jgi:hypothetical protein
MDDDTIPSNHFNDSSSSQDFGVFGAIPSHLTQIRIREHHRPDEFMGGAVGRGPARGPARKLSSTWIQNTKPQQQNENHQQHENEQHHDGHGEYSSGTHNPKENSIRHLKSATTIPTTTTTTTTTTNSTKPTSRETSKKPKDGIKSFKENTTTVRPTDKEKMKKGMGSVEDDNSKEARNNKSSSKITYIPKQASPVTDSDSSSSSLEFDTLQTNKELMFSTNKSDDDNQNGQHDSDDDDDDKDNNEFVPQQENGPGSHHLTRVRTLDYGGGRPIDYMGGCGIGPTAPTRKLKTTPDWLSSSSNLNASASTLDTTCSSQQQLDSSSDCTYSKHNSSLRIHHDDSSVCQMGNSFSTLKSKEGKEQIPSKHDNLDMSASSLSMSTHDSNHTSVEHDGMMKSTKDSRERNDGSKKKSSKHRHKNDSAKVKASKEKNDKKQTMDTTTEKTKRTGRSSSSNSQSDVPLTKSHNELNSKNSNKMEDSDDDDDESFVAFASNLSALPSSLSCHHTESDHSNSDNHEHMTQVRTLDYGGGRPDDFMGGCGIGVPVPIRRKTLNTPTWLSSNNNSNSNAKNTEESKQPPLAPQRTRSYQTTVEKKSNSHSTQSVNRSKSYQDNSTRRTKTSNKKSSLELNTGSLYSDDNEMSESNNVDNDLLFDTPSKLESKSSDDKRIAKDTERALNIVATPSPASVALPKCSKPSEFIGGDGGYGYQIEMSRLTKTTTSARKEPIQSSRVANDEDDTDDEDEKVEEKPLRTGPGRTYSYSRPGDFMGGGSIGAMNAPRRKTIDPNSIFGNDKKH